MERIFTAFPAGLKADRKAMFAEELAMVPIVTLEKVVQHFRDNREYGSMPAPAEMKRVAREIEAGEYQRIRETQEALQRERQRPATSVEKEAIEMVHQLGRRGVIWCCHDDDFTDLRGIIGCERGPCPAEPRIRDPAHALGIIAAAWERYQHLPILAIYGGTLARAVESALHEINPADDDEIPF